MGKVTAVLAFGLFIIVFINGVHQVNSQDDKMSFTYRRLRENLLKYYDKTARPVKNFRNTTVVSIALYPLFLVDLDEVKQGMYLDTWMLMTWTDERIAWDPKNYDGLENAHFGVDELWRPDISVYNGMEGNVMPKGITHFMVYKSGNVYWIPPVTITSYCSLDFKNYPNDLQNCTITLGSWSHSGEAIDLELLSESVNLNFLTNSNQHWNVVDVQAFKHVTYYNCCAEPYPTLEFSVFLQRRVPAANRLAFGPVIVSMMMTLAMFWLPPHSNKKIVLGSLALVVLVILITFVASSVKSPVVDYVSVAPMISGLYIVIAAIVMETLVITLTAIPNTCPSPAFLTPLLSFRFGDILCLRKTRSHCSVADRLQHQEGEVQQEKKTANEEEWYIVAGALDRLLFLVFFVTIIVIHKTA